MKGAFGTEGALLFLYYLGHGRDGAPRVLIVFDLQGRERSNRAVAKEPESCFRNGRTFGRFAT
jgi:hypothetical protein